MAQAILKASNQDVADMPGLFINNTTPSFSRDGKYIFFQLRKEVSIDSVKRASVAVDIWDYKDSVLQSEQLLLEGNSLFGMLFSRKETDNTYLGVVGVSSDTILRLEREDEQTVWTPTEVIGDYIIVTTKSFYSRILVERFLQKNLLSRFITERLS